MTRRNSLRQEMAKGPAPRRRQVVIAISVVLSLLAGWTMLASSGALDSVFSQKGKKAAAVSISSFSANSPSKEYIHAGGGGRLLATEEPASSGCGSPPPSPGNTLVATAQLINSVLSVRLDWTISSGADHYEVQRRQNITSAWNTLSPNPGNNTFTDAAVVTNTTYLYRVRAVDASGSCASDYSNVDLATTVIFTDESLQNQVIKAQHVTQLRQAIDAVRTTANIGQATWTNPLNQVSANHFSELRTRLNEALGLLGFSTISDDPGIAQGNIVYATHLQAVRDKVK